MNNASGDAYESLIQFLYRAPVGLIQTRADGLIEMLNPMSSNLLMPLSPDGDLSNLFTALRTAAPDLRRLCAAYTAPQGVICEAMRIVLPVAAEHRRDMPEVLSLGLLRIEGGRMMAVLVDATGEVNREQRTLALRVDSAVRTDTLTQLPNRAALRELLQRMATRDRATQGDEGALMFLNCDRFKQINDTLGSAMGDQVIGLVAGRLRAALRAAGRHGAHDALGEVAARVGGDEFAVLLDGLDSAACAERVAERLMQALGKPYRIGPHQIGCSFSISLVFLAGPIPMADDVLRDAGIAMVVAKAEGGGRCVVFQDDMRKQAAWRGSIEAELRVALERGELFTLYQPVVGLLPGAGIDRSAGVEALVRWRHPARGLVAPVEFIGIAEECGLIGAIGDYVLRTACHDFMRWQAEMGGLAPRLLAVNLSRALLTQTELCDTVAAILQDCGMRPEQLQLEITESLAAQGVDMQDRLRQLKGLGIKLALDDFGTGYSSLSSLHLMPVDTVKIDRSFVTLSDTSFHHEVLIEATVKVARSLGMSTVAEGIETEAQAAVVRRQGCDKAQGYLYSRPIPSELLLAWIRGEART
jgi:diguanylate cyclase (GGDEF)-like protein